MKAIQAVKKMVALGMGITMVGATIFGASAAKLSDWPAPFVTNGVPASNLAVIAGSNAIADDVVGMGAIIGALQAAAVVKTPIGGGGGKGVVVEGDAVEIGSTSDLLEINETLGDVRETITEVDLDMLKGGQIVTDEGSTEYNQYLRFNTTGGNFPPNGAVFFAEDERDRVGHYLFWNDNSELFEWELEFEEGLESEVEGDDLVDLEDEDIIILGQPFVVVDTDFSNISATAGSLKIELMGGAISAILGENDKETYVVDGKEYEVEVLVISETAKGGEGSVKFRINGEITDELEDGETDVLADGTQIGIRDILATGKDIQKSIVQFYLGAYKVEMEDTNTGDTTFATAGTEVNEETIEDSRVRITGNLLPGSTNKFEISDVKYTLLADAVLGDVYIPPGTGLREQLDEPEGMLTPFWDIRYEGLLDTGVTVVRIDAAGDDEYDLEFTNQEGIFYDVPLASNELGTFKFGDDDDDLWFVERDDHVITDDDFFIVSNCLVASNDNTCFTHVLRYDSIDTTNKQLTFTDLGTGTREVTYTSTSSDSGLAELVVGGITYRVNVSLSIAGNPIAVDLNGDDSSGAWGDDALDIGDTVTNASSNFTQAIGIQGEGIIHIFNGTFNMSNSNTSAATLRSSGTRVLASQLAAGTSFAINLTTLAKEFDEAGTDEVITWGVESRTGNRIGLVTADPAGAGRLVAPRLGQLFGPFDLEENEDLEQALSRYGVFFEIFDPTTTTEAEDLTIEYPLSQRGARVFVTGGLVRTTAVETGMSEKVQPLPVGVAMLSGDIGNPADIVNYNAIVVGGPCANPIAAHLMGNPEICWEAIDKAIVKLYEHTNGNVAMLVAGRTAKDTQRAARAVATGQIASVTGKEAEVSGTTLTDITVKAV